MKVKDLPVVMLAAGMSKRFNPEHRTTHKSLLRITNKDLIFDLILNGLIKNAVSQVVLILGYKSKDFKQYLSGKKNSGMKNLHLKSILANEDYVKGPAYTLLSIVNEIDENIGDFVVVPSDTIFHPSILEQVFSYNIDQFKNQNVLFSIQLSESSISKINRNIPFSPHLLAQSSIFHSLLEKPTPHYIKEYYIPILILSHSFLNFMKDPKNRISGKILQNMEKYQKETRDCHVIRLKYDLDIPPFLDIDTSHIYNTLNTVKKELLEAYKVK